MAMPGMPMQNMPGMMPAQQPMMMQQPMTQQPLTAAPRQWQPSPQATPSLGYLASGAMPPPAAKVRGVSAEPSPARVPVPAKINLPSPEELGITARQPAPPRPTATPPAPVDWNTVHTRLEKLGALRFQKDVLPAGGVRVTLILPTANPAMGQPVEAIAASEAVAIALALDRAEAWQKR
jgi:hypothetical protein